MSKILIIGAVQWEQLFLSRVDNGHSVALIGSPLRIN